MPILLTGASGFIGRAILENVNADIIPILRKPSDVSGKDELVFDLASSEDTAVLTTKLRGNDIKGIIHAAAVTPWSSDVNYDDDIAMAKNLVKLCESLEVPYLYLLSGWNVYDAEAAVPYTEKTLVKPNTPYGKSKIKTERYFGDNLVGTKLITLRLASLYGPGQKSPGLISNLVRNAFNKEHVIIKSLELKRDYLYINDFVETISNLVRVNFKENTVLNVGSGTSHSVKDVAQSIQDICRDEYGLNVVLKENIASEQVLPENNVLSNTALYSYGIHHRQTDFKEGLSSYMKWAKNENIL